MERRCSQGWPHSLGAVYTAVTQFLGFQIFSDEYKVMGLAPYGEPARLDRFREITTLTDKGFRVDPAYFGYHVGRENFFSKRFVQTFGPPRKSDGPVEKRHEDLAASLQARTEEVLIHLARIARSESGSPNLCLAGGVALNSVAVGKIIDQGIADRVFIPPCAGDAGVSLGAALYVSHALSGMDRAAPLRDARLGPEWGEERMRAALAAGGLEYEVSTDVISAAASALAAGEVLGWFQGRTEFGQRALGARSILADPRRTEMKDIINAKVKFREAFRPFASSVQEERLSEFFHGTLPCPFMTQVYRVRDGARNLIPAVTHADGTGRVQTVARDANPLYWELLQAFGAKTGVPILLNTSFNVKGEPIVNTPEDAVACFLKADLDLLRMAEPSCPKDSRRARGLSPGRRSGLTRPHPRFHQPSKHDQVLQGSGDPRQDAKPGAALFLYDNRNLPDPPPGADAAQNHFRVEQVAVEVNLGQDLPHGRSPPNLDPMGVVIRIVEKDVEDLPEPPGVELPQDVPAIL